MTWIFTGRTDAEAETPILWHLFRRADSFEKMLLLGKIKAGRKGDNRGWDGWMPSPTRWTWVWASPESWWWTGKPGVLQSMASQSRTWLSNWTEPNRDVYYNSHSPPPSPDHCFTSVWHNPILTLLEISTRERKRGCVHLSSKHF